MGDGFGLWGECGCPRSRVSETELTGRFPFSLQLITPIGIAIGMGVHATYNPNSGASLLSIGVLDSISAGILIYTGIVECLYHDVSLQTSCSLRRNFR